MTYEFPLLDLTGNFPSSPCKVVLDRPGRHIQGGFLCPSLYQPVIRSQSAFLRWNLCLTSLIHVAHGRGRSEFKMFVDSVSREAGPRDEMSVFDRL
jgi:hypothetical protein